MQRLHVPLRFAVLILVAACFISCSVPAARDQVNSSRSVWALDLIRTLPGRQAEYLLHLEANWARARGVARESGAVLSYQALVALPDTSRGWDVLLMTEYVDSLAWSNREVIFDSIFASPGYVRVPPPRPTSELRAFFGEEVRLRTLVSEPPR